MDLTWYPIAILVFGAVIVALEIYGKDLGYGPNSIRMLGLTLVIIAILFLVAIVAAAKVSAETAAAGFGLLGAIAGYLFGKSEAVV